MSDNIENIENILDEFNSIQEKGENPILTPLYPQDYQGKQILINADRLIFNARQQLTQETKGAANTSEGGDIHFFSHNFISFSTNGSIHLNTLYPNGDPAIENHKNIQNYIMLNAPNIFLGMDTAESRPKHYPTEPAVLGLENQKFMDELLNFIHEILSKLSASNIHIGDRGGKTSPVSSTWETMMKDELEDPEPFSIGALRHRLRDIKSRHVFIKK